MSDRVKKKAAIKRATAVAQRDATRLDGQALQQLKGVYQTAVDDIDQELKAAADQNNIIRLERLNRVREKMKHALVRLEQSRFQLLKQMMHRSAALGVGPWEKHIGAVTASTALDKALLTTRTFTANDGLQLSDRLWNLKDYDNDVVVKSVQRAVIRGYDASRSAAEFLQKGLPVPGDIQKAQLAANASSLSKGIGRDLLRSKDSAYADARRLFRTEINRAHGTAYQTAAFEDDDVIGTKFVLSPNHRVRDICDMHSSVNRYGLGRGVYPKGKSPWPAHPNTISYEEAVFADEVTEQDKKGKQDRISWLQHQDHDTKQAVLRSGHKVAALNGGVLTEQQISTPWKVLQKRYQRKGIDVSKLKPIVVNKPQPAIPVDYLPKGDPVSNVVQAKGYKAVTQRTLAAIDKVHGDGRLPSIPVKRSASRKFHGQYSYYIGGSPIDIKLSSVGDHKELTLAHELGHFLDHQGMGTVGQHASKSNRIFDKWRESVAKSDAINSVIKLFDGPAEINGYRIQKKYASYLLQTHEIWARSYAQYIAVRSGDKLMLEQLKTMQAVKQHASVYYASQWDDDDFEPIAKAIDELFEELGWLNVR